MKGKTICFCIPARRKHGENSDESSDAGNSKLGKNKKKHVAKKPSDSGDHHGHEASHNDGAALSTSNAEGGMAMAMMGVALATSEGSVHGGGHGGDGGGDGGC